ncbi:hypothetical protein D1AOALGA4SA_11169 [Olavius algarvensis Delta 1 endosymbiont]|nr:hypothetical protein D1AOALGA4SA_11169 [Olavius algarvensis Delta 1 endosymbiont]
MNITSTNVSIPSIRVNVFNEENHEWVQSPFKSQSPQFGSMFSTPAWIYVVALIVEGLNPLNSGQCFQLTWNLFIYRACA